MTERNDRGEWVGLCTESFGDPMDAPILLVMDVGGSMLCVSQFTLYGDLRKGRRPSFIEAEEPGRGKELYELFCRRLEEQGYQVARGRFGAHMLVDLNNDGPVTIVLDSDWL